MNIDVKFTETARNREYFPKNDFTAMKVKRIAYTKSFVSITYADDSVEGIRTESIESMEIT